MRAVQSLSPASAAQLRVPFSYGLNLVLLHAKSRFWHREFCSEPIPRACDQHETLTGLVLLMVYVRMNMVTGEEAGAHARVFFVCGLDGEAYFTFL